MPILKVAVENADELLNASFLGAGALGRVERSATGGGAGYSEIGTFALVSGTRLYTFYDLSGAVSSWYRIRYSKSDGTSPSSYGDEFQAGDETGGLLCSVYDVEQRLGTTLTANDRELVFDLIREVSSGIEGYCGRWFAPRPTDPASTATFYFTSPGHSYSRKLWIPKGVRTVTTLSYATSDQPDTGGTYTNFAANSWALTPSEPQRSPGWPATWIVLLSTTSGYFYPYLNGVKLVGSLGFAAVPYDIQGVAISAVIRRYIGKATSAPAVAIGPEGGVTLLRDVSPDSQRVLDYYRVIPV